jgi:hypothetical protein
MNAKEMEAKIKELEGKVAVLEDLEAIKRLQRSYGYYLEHWMYEEVIDCFADDPDTELNIMVGIYTGKEGIRRYFSGEKARSMNPEVLHQIMQLSGVVDIDSERKTAEGRWYGWGVTSLPAGEGVLQTWTNGIYTSKYLKENGKWKILKLMWNPVIMPRPGAGWVKPERVANITPDNSPKAPPADKPRDIDSRYPSGYIVPFHYRHPVTGKETSERKHNRDLNIKGAE